MEIKKAHLDTDDNLAPFLRLIYNTTSDPSFWPQIISILDSANLGSNNNNDYSSIKKHFKNAAFINNRLNSDNYRREKQLASSKQILNSLLIGFIQIDKELNILLLNKTAENINHKHNLFDSFDSTLMCRNTDLRNSILSFINFTFKKNKDKSLLQTTELGTIRIIFSSSSDTKGLINIYLIPKGDLNFHADGLNKLFKLSHSESIVVKRLLSGDSIKEAAFNENKSVNTVYRQLNSIYSKTNTHSHSELIRLFVNSPVSWKNDNDENEVEQEHYEEGFHNTFKLKNGYKLCYATYGPANGKPVFLFHRNFSCRIQRPPKDELLYKYNIKLIIPDRPGFGGSDYNKKHNLSSWCEDFEQLVARLNIGKYSIIGYSTGGCYAVACSHFMPEQLDDVYLINTPGPFKSMSELRTMAATEKLLVGLSYYAPNILKLLLGTSLKNLKVNEFYTSVLKRSCAADKIILEQEHIKTNFLQSTNESIKNDANGIIQQFLHYTKPWGFPLMETKANMNVWYGMKGDIIPKAATNRFIKSLPSPNVRWFSEDGHHLIYKYWEEILTELS